MTRQFATGSSYPHERDTISDFASFVLTTLLLIGFSFTWYRLVEDINANDHHSSVSTLIQSYPIVSGVAVVLSFIALVSALIWGTDNKKETPYWIAARLIVAIALFAILATFVVLGFFVSLYFIGVFFVEVIWPPIKEQGLQGAFFAATSFAAITAAYLAYRLRCKQRVMYGSIEMLFGICTIVYSAFTALATSLRSSTVEISKSEATQLAIQVLAGIYIVVRGLNNIEDGLKKGPIDLSQLYDWITSFIRHRFAFIGGNRQDRVSDDSRM